MCADVRMAENTLYYADNLDILHRYVPSESIDLIYLDPPPWRIARMRRSADHEPTLLRRQS
jgi:hypothetical protein